MRLQRYLAHAGVSSRRAAEDIIRAGRVTVDGETVTDPARDTGDHHDVRVDGERVAPEPTVVWAVHKPQGYVSTAADTHDRRTVVQLVDSPLRLYPVGRLDADTTGLILLTNDGDLAHRLTHPSHEVEKVYEATVSEPPVKEAALRLLRKGVQLDDGWTAPAKVRRMTLQGDVLEIVLREGRKRQVRRMCEAVGHPVRALRRVAIGSLRLDLPLGAARKLTAEEIERL